MSETPKASRAAAPARTRTPKPSPATSPATPTQRAGFAFFGGIDGLGTPDPMQAAMDAAVAEHNRKQRAGLERALAGKRPGHSLKGGGA